jgi:hypothetical protein
MSSVNCKAGTIELIPVPAALSFLEAVEYIKTFVVDFPWEDLEEENEFIRWETEKQAVMYLNNHWYLVNYECNNDDLWMDCFHELDGKLFFAQVYYDGGTYIEEILARGVAEHG